MPETTDTTLIWDNANKPWKSKLPPKREGGIYGTHCEECGYYIAHDADYNHPCQDCGAMTEDGGVPVEELSAPEENQ